MRACAKRQTGTSPGDAKTAAPARPASPIQSTIIPALEDLS